MMLTIRLDMVGLAIQKGVGAKIVVRLPSNSFLGLPFFILINIL